MQLNEFEYWINANMPPSLAFDLTQKFNINACSFYFLNLNLMCDLEVFNLAKEKGNIIIISKDSDFTNIVILMKLSPLVVWVTIRNASNSILISRLLNSFEKAIFELLQQEKPLIEIY